MATSMKHRPTILDRLLFVAARHHADRVYRQFARAVQRANTVQEQVLLSKIRRHADSDFGREHDFDAIRTVDDFRRRVPIGDYEAHRPYIERVKRGEPQALFGPGTRVHMFALSSGTVDQPKYIPVTQHFLAEYRRGWNVFGIKALLDHPGTFLRGIVQITSRMDESYTDAGIPCGAITGLMAATQKLLVRKYYLAPRGVARIDDPTAKYYTIMRLSVPNDAAFLITANPATQLKLARTADEHRDALIRDVHDGTLRDDLPIPAKVRAELHPRLRPDPASARFLEQCATEHGRLLPKHYWQLGFLANWTGGTMGLYLRDFPEYFGDVPVRDIGLLASEGRVSIPIDDGTAAGILDVTSHFFEFIPTDQIDRDSPRALRSHELDPGQEYFVILSTSSGLWRYNLGDVVRVEGYHDEAPIVTFLNKGAHVASLAGEKLTEHQVILAMEQVRSGSFWTGSNFVLAPRWDRQPYYVLHVETQDVSPPATDNAPAADHVTATDLAGQLDAALQRVNVEYAGKRQTDRLGPVRLNHLPPGVLAERDRRRSEQYRRGNEQYKHQYLLTTPNADAELDTPATPARPSHEPMLSEEPQ